MELLKSRDLILKEDYGPVTLTDAGRDLSIKIYERHRVIKAYLAKSLNLSLNEAEENACRMEHIISEEMFEAIKEYLKEEQV